MANGFSFDNPVRDAGAHPALRGDSVSIGAPTVRRPLLISPAARKALQKRMLLFRTAALERIEELTACSPAELRAFRHELVESDLTDILLQRGAGIPFTRELPQGALLYLLVRALRPEHVVETGVRPGYSTAWILAGLEANRRGELSSLGPGNASGRAAGVHDVTIGQFVPPSLRTRWTLVLGNSEERLHEAVDRGRAVDLFFYDNGPDPVRARFELRVAWAALSARGILLAHRVDANSAWHDFCVAQGVPDGQLLDAGPPPMGALAMRAGHL